MTVCVSVEKDLANRWADMVLYAEGLMKVYNHVGRGHFHTNHPPTHVLLQREIGHRKKYFLFLKVEDWPTISPIPTQVKGL